MRAQTSSIVIDQFEGPLALLLELVERNQMPVENIAVATITRQYLEQTSQLEGLSPEALGEFLQLGSRLTYIKSLALLPATHSAPDDEQTDELQQLSRELAEYQRYQAAARTLAAHAARPRWPRPVGVKLASDELPLPQLALSDLAAAFAATLRRLEPARPTRSLAPQLSQAEVVTKLKLRLAKGAFELGDLLAGLRDRLEVVVTFSALLELIRSGAGRVTQIAQFEPIMVEARQ